MSSTAILIVGGIVTGLCVAFLWISWYEIKHLSRDPEEKTHAKPYL